MPRRDIFLISTVFIAGFGSALAQETGTSGLTGMVELRAHRALIQQMERPDTVLTPFETDGCSGGMSDIWRLVSDQLPDFEAAHEQTPPWETCCVTHDAAYHNADSAKTAQESYDARVLADKKLRQCVIDTGEIRTEQVAAHYDVDPDTVSRAYGVIADAMHLAVRFGGGPCSGLPWRWGFGYPDCSILRQIPEE